MLEASSRPFKPARTELLSRVMSIQEKHEDVAMPFDFNEDDSDVLAEYDEQVAEQRDEDETCSDDAVFQKLAFDFSTNDPNIPFEDLQQLDSVADRVEVKRLQGMKVFIDANDLQCESLDAVKSLSTRFVRAWRPKTIGGQERRSRLVAREFARLDERSDLFSQHQTP